MLIAKSNIKHNGVEYKSNETILDIEHLEAQRLVDLKVAVFMGKSMESMEPNPASYEELLDEKFNHSDLKEVAKELQLDFQSNISKKNLIDLIIKSNKAEDALVLEFEEVDED